ncbi:MAG: hypothetical protein ACREJQ_04325 [bacterium]
MTPDQYTEEALSRPKRQRSSNYPRYNLELCIHAAHELWGAYKRNELSGISKVISVTARMGKKHHTLGIIAAMRQFGLLEPRKLRLTEFAERTVREKDAATRQPMLLEAFTQPPLYRKLISRWAQAPLPRIRTLADSLASEHKITEKAKARAARIFIESARYAQAITDAGQIIPKISRVSTQGHAASTDSGPTHTTLPFPHSPDGERRAQGAQQLRLEVTPGRLAVLIELPPALTKFEADRLSRVIAALAVDDKDAT